MKGLLIKDFYMLMKYFRTYLIIIVVMSLITMFSSTGPIFIIYPVIMASMIPVSLLNYDEHAHFDVYAQTLPLSKAKLVSTKYLISIIFQIVSVSIFTIAYAVSLAREGQFDTSSIYLQASYMTFLVSVLPSILLPFVYKFGSEKGRMFYLLFTAIIGGIVIFIVNQEETLADIFKVISGPSSILITLGLSMIIYGISWLISVYFYTKREIV